MGNNIDGPDESSRNSARTEVPVNLDSTLQGTWGAKNQPPGTGQAAGGLPDVGQAIAAGSATGDGQNASSPSSTVSGADGANSITQRTGDVGQAQPLTTSHSSNDLQANNDTTAAPSAHSDSVATPLGGGAAVVPDVQNDSGVGPSASPEAGRPTSNSGTAAASFSTSGSALEAPSTSGTPISSNSESGMGTPASSQPMRIDNTAAGSQSPRTEGAQGGADGSFTTLDRGILGGSLPGESTSINAQSGTIAIPPLEPTTGGSGADAGGRVSADKAVAGQEGSLSFEQTTRPGVSSDALADTNTLRPSNLPDGGSFPQSRWSADQSPWNSTIAATRTDASSGGMPGSDLVAGAVPGAVNKPTTTVQAPSDKPSQSATSAADPLRSPSSAPTDGSKTTAPSAGGSLEGANQIRAQGATTSADGKLVSPTTANAMDGSKTASPGTASGGKIDTAGPAGPAGRTDTLPGTRTDNTSGMPDPKISTGRSDVGPGHIPDPRIDSGRSDVTASHGPNPTDSHEPGGPTGGSAGTPYAGGSDISGGGKGIKGDVPAVLPPGSIPDGKIGSKNPAVPGESAGEGKGAGAQSPQSKSPESETGADGGRSGSEPGKLGTESKSSGIGGGGSGSKSVTDAPGSGVKGATDGKGSAPGAGGGSRINPPGERSGTDKGSKVDVPGMLPVGIPLPDIAGGIKGAAQRIFGDSSGAKTQPASTSKGPLPDIDKHASGGKDNTSKIVPGDAGKGQPEVDLSGTKTHLSDTQGAKNVRGGSDQGGPKTVRTVDGRTISPLSSRNEGVGTLPHLVPLEGLAVILTGGLKGIAQKIFPPGDRSSSRATVDRSLPGPATKRLDQSPMIDAKNQRSEPTIALTRVLQGKTADRPQHFTVAPICSKHIPNLVISHDKEKTHEAQASTGTTKRVAPDSPSKDGAPNLKHTKDQLPKDDPRSLTKDTKRSAPPPDAGASLNSRTEHRPLLAGEELPEDLDLLAQVSPDDEAERLLSKFENLSTEHAEENEQEQPILERALNFDGAAEDNEVEEQVVFDSLDNAAANDDEQLGRYDYIVEPGDTLESIAAKELKDVNLAPLIYQINQSLIRLEVQSGRMVFVLNPGTIISLPHPREIEKAYGGGKNPRST